MFPLHLLGPIISPTNTFSFVHKNIIYFLFLIKCNKFPSYSLNVGFVVNNKGVVFTLLHIVKSKKRNLNLHFPKWMFNLKWVEVMREIKSLELFYHIGFKSFLGSRKSNKLCPRAIYKSRLIFYSNCSDGSRSILFNQLTIIDSSKLHLEKTYIYNS